MALIKNASNLFTKGINEAYGVLSTGAKNLSLSAMADKARRDLQKGKEVVGGMFGPTAYAAESGGSGSAGMDTSQPSGGGSQPVYKSSSSSGGGSSTGGKVSGWSAEAEKKAAQEAKFKNNLGKAYKGLGGSLSKLAGFLPDEENRLTTGINDLFGQYKDTLEKDTTSQLGELGKYKADKQEEQRKSLKELADNTRKSFMSGNTILGSKGASDSSAAGMYANAVTSEANKSRGELLTQAQKIYDEITGKEKAVHETHDLELSNMDRWVGDQSTAIKDDFKAQRAAIMDEMDSADDRKKADLERLDQQNLNAAYSKLSELENRAYSYRNVLTGWRDDVLGKINTMKQSIIQRGDFTPEELKMNDPNTDLQFDESQSAEDFYDPNAPKRKKVVKGFLDNPLTEEDLMTD